MKNRLLKSLWLGFILLLTTNPIWAAPLMPEVSDDVNEHWYQIVFQRPDATLALQFEGDEAVIKTGVFEFGAENQLWKIEAGENEGYYVFTSKSGKTIYFDGGRFKAGNSVTEIKLLVSASTAFPNSWELQRLGSTTQAMNPFQGSFVGKEIAEYNVGDGGNPVKFVNANFLLLNTLVDAKTTRDNTKAGNDPGTFTDLARTDFEAAIESAQAVLDSETSTQDDFLTARAALVEAISDYNSTVILPQISDDVNEYWYYLQGTRPDNSYITNVIATHSLPSLSVIPDDTQLWKFVQNTNPEGTENGFALQNKATGEYIGADVSNNTVFKSVENLPKNNLKFVVSNIYTDKAARFWIENAEGSTPALRFHAGGAGHSWSLMNYTGDRYDNSSYLILDYSAALRTFLNMSIKDAENLLEKAIEGDDYGQFNSEAISIFTSALNDAKSTLNNEEAGESELAGSRDDLINAISDFKAAQNRDLNLLISGDNTVERWYQIKNVQYGNVISSKGLEAEGGIVCEMPEVAGANGLWKFKLNEEGTAVRLINKTTELSIEYKGTSTQALLIEEEASTWLELNVQGINTIIGKIGAETYDYFHCAGSNTLVGWEAPSLPSQWIIDFVAEDLTDVAKAEKLSDVENIYNEIVNTEDNTPNQPYVLGEEVGQYSEAKFNELLTAYAALLEEIDTNTIKSLAIAGLIEDVEETINAFIESEVVIVTEKWYFVKSQRYNTGGPWWKLGEDNFVVPGTLDKSDAQKFTIVNVGETDKVTIKSHSGLLFTAKAHDAEGGNFDEVGPATGWDMVDNEVDGVVGKAFPGENKGIHQGSVGWGWKVSTGWYDLSDNCTFFFYEVREDIDLQIAIDDAIVMLNKVSVGEGIGLTPEEAVEAFEAAIETAKETLESTDLEEIEAALTELSLATKAFVNAKVPAVTSSTEENPVWYLIKNLNRGGVGATLYTNGFNAQLKGTTVANSIPADGTGEEANAIALKYLFRFERLENGNFKIINAAYPKGEILQAGSGGSSSQVVNYGTARGDNWDLRLLGYNEELDVNELNFVSPNNTTWHLDGSYNLVSWLGGQGSPSAWYVEEYTGSVADLYKGGLTEQLEKANELNELLVVGDYFNQVSTEAKEAFEEAILAAQAIHDNEDSTAGEFTNAIATLAEAMNDFGQLVENSIDKLLAKEEDNYAWFMIKSTALHTYANGKVISLGEREINQKFTFEAQAEEVDDTQLFRFELNEDKTAIVNIVNKAEPNTYFGLDGKVLAEALEVEDNFTLVQLEDGYSFNIKPTGVNAIHAQDAGSHIVNWAGAAGSASAWTLVFVEEISTSVSTVYGETYKITVQDRMIYVEGVDNFDVYSINGQKMSNRAIRLQNGIYIVKVGETAHKVLVK